MSDPSQIVAGIEAAQDAFEYRGRGAPEYEQDVSRESQWKTQLTKACRYLESARSLRATDGYNGAVVELCFAVVERSLEAYLLWNTDDDLSEYHDHETVYGRAAERGLFDAGTAEDLKRLYGRNRTEHYYGRLVPTQQKEDAMFSLADAVHEYVGDQVREGGVCTCG